MRLRWHDFTTDRYKEHQPTYEKVIAGAKGTVKTYGIHQANTNLKEVSLSVQVGPLVIRQIIFADVETAKLHAQEIEWGKGRYA